MAKIETADLKLATDLLLIKPYKLRYKVVEQAKFDDEKNKGKDPKKDIMHLKTEKERIIDGNYQTAEIVQVSKDNRLGLEIGDIVVLDWRKAREFDMFKKVYIVQLYEVVAQVIINV